MWGLFLSISSYESFFSVYGAFLSIGGAFFGLAPLSSKISTDTYAPTPNKNRQTGDISGE